MERVLSPFARSPFTATNSLLSLGVMDMPVTGVPQLVASFTSTLPDESAHIQILDPLVQVAAVLPGARQDCQVSVAAAVGGGDHDNGPGRRRTVARGDAVPGEPGG